MKRALGKWDEANLCGACSAEAHALQAVAAPDYAPTLATCGVTDAQEQPGGSWQETAMRFGCDKHPVASMVRFLSGECISFEEYQRRMTVVSEVLCG